MSLLKVDNINVSYGEIQVVFDLSLQIKEGEIISIIGANGAGKSTLLKTISGMLEPIAGTIEFDNEIISKLEPHEIVEKGLIHVPEGRRLFSLMSVYENLEIGAYSKNAEKHFKDSIEEVFKLFPRLQERKKQLAVTLSGGEQQMVAIGRGIMGYPKLMMLDEPSLGLAPLLKKDIFTTISKISKEYGTTILLVEQDVINSLAISDRAYVMEHGQFVIEGSPDDLMDNPEIKKAYLGL
ncbi:ABC transporter ATP-binding protein [Flexistipes sp.]|uniref:ABC transporter ATP-binding protein n=1 Tax=Flexistipes sp. TaxID=3088135 RepID=UPI003FA5B7AF